MRAAARTFPVRAAASSSTSSFAPPPTSSSAQTASELGAGSDFVMALTLTLTLSLTLALALAQSPPTSASPQATPALLRTCFSRSISAVAPENKPVPVVTVGSRPQHRIQQRARRQTLANLGVRDTPTRTATLSPATTQNGVPRSFPTRRTPREWDQACSFSHTSL